MCANMGCGITEPLLTPAFPPPPPAQRWHVSDEGARFVKLYKLQSFPCICVIDPRTSENLGTFKSVLTPQDFFSHGALVLQWCNPCLVPALFVRLTARSPPHWRVIEPQSCRYLRQHPTAQLALCPWCVCAIAKGCRSMVTATPRFLPGHRTNP